MSSAQRNPVHNEDEFRALLLRQHGLVTAHQARTCGIAAPALSRRVDAGVLERVYPRVYRSTLVPTSVRQSALAAVLWAGPTAIASHATAAELLGIEGAPAGNVELWVPGGSSARAVGLVVHRGTVDAVDRRMRDGIPITSPARTLIDLASCLDRETLEAAVEDVLHRGMTTPAMIERRLDALGGKGRAGAGRLRAVLRTRGSAALESRLEVKLWAIVRTIVPRPVRQYEVRIESRKYRLDVAWPVLKVAVEADGYVVHGTRRAFVRDRRRLADLVAAGWAVILATWEDCVDDPDALVRRIHAVMRHAA